MLGTIQRRVAVGGGLAIVPLVCAALVAVPTAHASLMAYEGFNYAIGSGNLTSQSSGFGWNGAWQGVVGGSSSVQGSSLTAGANAPSSYDSHSSGKSAFTSNGTRTGRFLDTSAGGSFGLGGYLNASGNIGTNGKTIYISFLQQPNVANNNYYEFELHRGNLNDPGRIGGVGCDTGGSSSVYLRTPSANQTVIGPASTSVSFYVVRIDFLGGNDTVRVYQNPTSATEPASPTLLETGAGDMSFNGISFGAFANSTTVAHDEVRLGQTWSDVVSPGAYSTGTWVGGGADKNWGTGGNWDNGVVPVFATGLLFAGNTGLANTNNLTGVSANNITFDSAAGAFTLAGNSLGLNGNISFNGNPASPITQTINLPLVPSGNVTIDTPANSRLVLGGNITSGSGLTTIDNGTVTLSGTNAFTQLSANGGTNIITGNTTITGGGVFYLADGGFVNNCKDTLIIQPGATLTVTGNYTDAGVIGRNSGSGTVIQNGGTFSFNPSNQTALFVGASGSTATRSEYDMNGGLLDMNGDTLGVALGAGAVITGLVNQVSGVITNVGNLYFSPFFAQGQGIYNLTGGSIYIGSGGITVFSGGGYQMNLGGGTIGAETSWSSALNMTFTGSNGPVTFNPADNTVTLSGVLSGAGGLNVSGGGVLELSGANTYAGDTTVNAGSTLQLDVTGSSSGAFRVANGGMLNLNYTGYYAVGNFYTNGVALPVGTYNSGNLPGVITGTGNLQVQIGIANNINTPNLLARWQLNEANPPYSDSGPNGIPLVLDPLTSAPVSSTLSIEGLSAQLTSTAGPVTRLSATNAALQKDSFGFSFWLNPVNVNLNDNLLAKEMPYDNTVANAKRLSWQLYVGGNSGLTLVVRGNDRSKGDVFGSIQSSVSIPLNAGSGQWFHIAGGYDAATGILSLFVNGVGTTSAGLAGAHSSDSSPVVIGTVKNGTDIVSSGAIALFDDVQFFDGPLSASDVAALRTNPGQVVPTVTFTIAQALHLLAHWKLDELSPPFADVSGHSIALNWDSATTLPNRVVGINGNAEQLTWQSPGPSTRLTANDPLLQIDSFGFSFWINPDFLKPLDNIIAKEMPYNPAVTNWDRLAWQVQVGRDDGSGSAPLEFVVRGNDRAQGDFWGNVFSTSRLPLYTEGNGWIHIAGGYDSTTGTLKLFVNGVEDDSINSSLGGHCSDNTPIDIGTVKNGGDFVDFSALTQIDDIQIYDGVPSAYEVQNLKLNPGQVSTNTLALNNPTFFPTGSAQVKFGSYVGVSYVVEATTNLLVGFVSVAGAVAVNKSTTVVVTKGALDSAFGTGPRPQLFFRVYAVDPVNQQCE